MQPIKITNLEYETFEEIRDLIYENLFFAIIHVGYSRKLKCGVFVFWDDKYVPNALKEYIGQIPGNKEKVEILNEKFKDVIDGK